MDESFGPSGAWIRAGRSRCADYHDAMSDQLYLVADFNADTLARYLAHTALPGAEVKTAPFGQVSQSLAGPGPGADWSAVVWTQPSSVSDTFRRAAVFEPVDAADAIEDATAFAESI